jgi:hypothetical protein
MFRPTRLASLAFARSPKVLQEPILRGAVRLERRGLHKSIARNQIPFPNVMGRERLVSSFQEMRISDRCHIIGSGASLLESVDLIGQKDAVFSCNLGCFIGRDIDLLTIEFARHGQDRVGLLSELQRISVLNTQAKIRQKIFKNVWQDRLHWGYINSNYGPESQVLKDVHLPLESRLDIASETVINILKSPPGDLIVQLRTSVVTLVFIAYWSGYKEIVVHGLDGGGEYYFQRRPEVLPETIRQQMLSAFPSTNTKRYHVANGIVGIFLSNLACHLENDNVSLFSAASNSPSSHYLKVFKS